MDRNRARDLRVLAPGTLPGRRVLLGALQTLAPELQAREIAWDRRSCGRSAAVRRDHRGPRARLDEQRAAPPRRTRGARRALRA